MPRLTQAFWSASIEEMSRGYSRDGTRECYTCLICGAEFAPGNAFAVAGEDPDGAEAAVRRHVEEAHGSAFDSLLDMEKRYTGLTGRQKTYLKLWHEGLSDRETAQRMGLSESTIRNMRFKLRERAKEAKVFLALFSALPATAAAGERLLDPPRGAAAVDERFILTERERDKVLRTFLGPDGRLEALPSGEKRRIALLHHLAGSFTPGRRYREREVNAVLKAVYEDYAILRRLLVEYGFLDRTADGREYWVKS